MKFLNYTFEQSQSLVTKETVDKLNQKGSWKRFIGLFITSIVIYCKILLPLGSNVLPFRTFKRYYSPRCVMTWSVAS